MAQPEPERICVDHPNKGAPEPPEWRTRFIDTLAATSNVTRAAEVAGIRPERAYSLRRSDTDFARAWLGALADGYLHLEMEVIRRLREGDGKIGDGDKFDFANAIRVLAAHRDHAARHNNQVRDVSAAEVKESIDRRIDELRRRVAREKAAAQGNAA